MPKGPHWNTWIYCLAAFIIIFLGSVIWDSLYAREKSTETLVNLRQATERAAANWDRILSDIQADQSQKDSMGSSSSPGSIETNGHDAIVPVLSVSDTNKSFEVYLPGSYRATVINEASASKQFVYSDPAAPNFYVGIQVNPNPRGRYGVQFCESDILAEVKNDAFIDGNVSSTLVSVAGATYATLENAVESSYLKLMHAQISRNLA